MASNGAEGRRVTAENRAGGLQPLHQGDGDLSLNTGLHGVQHNIRQQFNYYHSPIPQGDPTPKETLRSDIIQWLVELSPPNFQNSEFQHDSLRSLMVQGTGTWVLEHTEFQGWKKEPAKLLWMHGDLGAGKTMLASLVIDSIKKESTNQVACIYMYFHGAQDYQPDLVSILINLLKQILQQQASDEMQKQITSIYEACRDLGKRPTREEYLDMLEAACLNFSRVYLVVDALDDCHNSHSKRTQDEFLGVIQHLRCLINILITTRTTWNGRDILNADRKIRVEPKRGDIERYVKTRIKDNERLGRMIKKSTVQEFEEEVVKTVANATKGVFLITKLHMDYLCEQETAGDVHSALYELPKNVASAFETSIHQIKKKDESRDKRIKQGLAQHVLTWISNAATPMEAEQLCLTFALHHEVPKLNMDFMPDANDLASACAGLVTVDPNSKTLRLVHDSVQEHLVRHRVIPENPHRAMARACLLSLLLDNADDEIVKPLTRYSAQYWITHYRQGEQQSQGPGDEALVFRFLRDHKMVLRAFEAIPGERNARFQGMNGLHAAVHLGSERWAKSLIEEGFDVNSRCRDGRTPLHWATKLGHCSLVRMLIGMGAHIDALDKLNNTPLHDALLWPSMDCGDIVRVLVGAKARVDIRGRKGLTPLSWSIQHGSAADVKMLLTNQDVNAEDDQGWCPLREAISYNFFDVALMLLRKGANPNWTSSIDGWTPLMAAVQAGMERLVRHLIKEGANVNHRSKEHGFTPLRWAIHYSHTTLVHLLLRSGANVNVKAEDELTPLLALVSATKNAPLDGGKARQTMIWMLLEYGARVDDQDKNGRTALHLAVLAKDKSLVWLLLTNKATVDIKDKDEFNALDRVVALNESSIAWVLCEHGARPGQITIDGMSPLHEASRQGHAKLVQCFLLAGVDSNIFDAKSRTPLHYAAYYGHDVVVNILALDGADLDEVDGDGLTALAHATASKSMAVIRVLLEHGASCDIPDGQGRTPLHYAVGTEFNEGLALLVQKSSNVNSRDLQGLTALHRAAGVGDKEAIKILLSSRANRQVRDYADRTPLALAMQLKQGREVYSLLQ